MTDATLLNQIRTGMRVRTSDGQKLGTVRQVHQSEAEAYLEVILGWSPWKVWHVVMQNEYVFLPGATVTSVAGKQIEIALDAKTAKSYTWCPGWIKKDGGALGLPGASGGAGG